LTTLSVVVIVLLSGRLESGSTWPDHDGEVTR
jgi:hypothetical protein